MLLCVKNQLVEDVCEISFSMALTMPLAALTRLIITDYCRDEKILNSTPQFYIRPDSALAVRKFTGFLNYLKERKKVAIAKIESGDSIYILPPNPEDVAEVRLGCIRVQQQKANQAQAQIQPVPPPVSTSSSCGPRPSDSGAGGHSFMSDLLQKVETEQTWRRPTRNEGTLPAAKKNSYIEFENYVRRRITSFFPDCTAGSNSNYNSNNNSNNSNNNNNDRSNSSNSSGSKPEALFLEPMEKSQRYVVHDIVSSEFGGVLLTASNGERGDRHVVVYRVGHPPEGVSLENYIDPVSIQSVRGAGLATQTASRRHTQVHQNNALQVVGTEGLTLVGTVKRDRRTLEEIQQDMKRRKVIGGTASAIGGNSTSTSSGAGTNSSVADGDSGTCAAGVVADTNDGDGDDGDLF